MKELDATQQAARQQFQKQSANYGKSHILANVEDVVHALEGVELPAGGRALDVATGGGHTALHLATLGLRVIAADITPAMLENAARLAVERGLSLETALHEAESLPYGDGEFDIVSCRVAAHHFSDREAFVRESVRVLRRGGVFLLIDGSIPDGEPEAEEWLHHVEKLRDPSHGRFLTPGAWSALCESQGLIVRKCETTPMKQPDLEWYFQTAATPPANRDAVRRLVEDAPESARRVLRIGREEERIVWWWPRLSLVAVKA